ncbi:MAG TPA: ROK family protein [Sphingobacteriaceae bacterium]
MSILGIDLGGTKLAVAVFGENGAVMYREVIALGNREGETVGELIKEQVKRYLTSEGRALAAIGICVPGIYRSKTGTVWAPNIPGWDDYPLLEEIQKVAGDVPVWIDSDRACYILGELWKGNARGCRDAVYMAVGTGIGAGILINGTVLRGADDIAGAIGWMALNKPFKTKYIPCGCFEYYASGKGMARLAGEIMEALPGYNGTLSQIGAKELTAHHIFSAYEQHDEVAIMVIKESIVFWGMAIANLISIFNPEKIILGGGIFGPAARFIPEIREEAKKWAQPVSVTKVILEQSEMGGDAAVFGAAYLALSNIKTPRSYEIQ